MTYALGPVIGSVGGTKIDEVPVEGAASGGTGTVVTLSTIDVQPGETVLASFIGTITPGAGNAANHPSLNIGAVTTVRHSGQTGIAATLTGNRDIADDPTRIRKH